MSKKQEIIVLIHGIYTGSVWLRPMARRLQQAGYETVFFRYPSVRSTPAANAAALNEQVEALQASMVHYLAHSLGGLVVRHLFHQFPDRRPGRVVTLGTPHQGSFTAQILHDRGMGFALGSSIDEGLLGDMPPLSAGLELGSLAGTLNMGIGRLLTGLSGPSDGTVSVAETRLTGMQDHICLPVNHTGMLFAPAVTDQACIFFATGQFDHTQ